MEVVGLAFSAISILQSIESRIRTAIKQQKDLGTLLSTYQEDVLATQTVVKLIHDEKLLQTAGISVTIQRIHVIGENLDNHLNALATPRSAVKGFVHQLANGTAELQELADIMSKLSRSKQDLIVGIQLAHVGLTKTVDQAIAINTSKVEETNAAVQKALGSEYGLRIAKLVHDLGERSRTVDGKLQITQEEFNTFAIEDVKVAHPEIAIKSSGDRQRIVCDNLAKDQALQILGPIAQDMWAEMALIKISGNIASGDAIQAAYPMNMDVFDKLLASRKR